MITRGIDMRLNVRPVFIGFVHQYYYEGPCRFERGEALTGEYERMMNPHLYKDFVDTVKQHVSTDVCNILDPVYVEREDDWVIPEKIFEEMGKESDKVDLYILSAGIGRGTIVTEFAVRFKKPMMMLPTECCNLQAASAAVTSKGVEYYSCLTWEDFEQQLRVLRVRKVLQNTRILLATRFNSNYTIADSDSFFSLDDVTDKFGIKFRYMNVHELIDMMSPLPEGGNHTTPGRKTPNLDENDLKEVKRLADELTAGAEVIDIQREYLENSLKAYVTIKKNLDIHECSAFTVPCPDSCSTRRLNENKFTFCFSHSLLTEEGIPSACEYDINALVSMIVLTNISGKAPYMGNTNALPIVDGKVNNMAHFDASCLDNVSDTSNLYNSAHSVPNRAFKGIDKEKSNYSIRHFAHDQGFGAVMRYDFKQDIGQTITACRFSPDMTKMFVGKGEIVSGAGYGENNCNNSVVYRVADIEKFFKAQSYVGNHLPLVYGDYTAELCELGRIMGFEVMSV